AARPARLGRARAWVASIMAGMLRRRLGLKQPRARCHVGHRALDGKGIPAFLLFGCQFHLLISPISVVLPADLSAWLLASRNGPYGPLAHVSCLLRGSGLR